jgi:diguanylate cyclase (GGDEF)-like protein/PAS domain S-box-containing protein
MTKPQICVLIVEDDRVDRLACRRALAQDPDYEFVLSEAETGQEGLQLAHAQKPDCVLLDYHLPDMNGLEFLAELRNDLGEIPVPVMMLTGADNASVAVEAMKRGAQDYLVKDVNRQYLELLPAVIQRVLRERRMLTEKKQAKERLVQAEAKYRSLVEQIPAIAYIAALNLPGNLLYISPQIRQLGFSPEEWLADPEGLLKQIHPEDHMLVRAEIARGYESGESLRCEYRLLTRAGEVRWFLNKASLVRDESGEPLFLQGVLVDITEDKQVEEELRQHRRRLEELVAKRTTQLEKQAAVLKSANANLASELGARAQAESALKKYADRLADLYNNAPCGYHSLDPDGVFVQINDTELKWLGRAREEVVGKMRFTDLLTPASGKTFQESYPRFKELGWERDLEFEIALKDGTSLSVLLNATAIKDATGHFVMSRTTMFDITDRKRTEQALRASKELFRLLLESAGEGIYGLDTAGRCTFVNDAALKMMGYTRDEILGRQTHECIHHTRADGSPYPAEECPIYDAFRNGTPIHGHTEILWPKDGSSFPAEYSSHPIREGGRISGAVLVFRNITQERKLVQQLSYQASHDALTGLANRRDFEQRLERVLTNACADGSEHALCYLDLDRFKVINDTCGHAAGDQLLRQLSALLQEQMRSRDTLARLGGDEFGLLLEHCPLDRAWRIAEELLQAVQQFKFAWEGKVHGIGVSIGVVPITAASESLPAMLRAADAACYTAKGKGRNRAYVYQADDAELTQRSSEMQRGARPI